MNRELETKGLFYTQSGRAGSRRMSARAVVAVCWLAPLIASGGAWATDPVLLDFRGSLPPGATLLRDTPRIGADGSTTAPNTPRFETCAVGAAAINRATLPEDERVLAVRDIGPTTYTLVYLNCGIALTTDTPGLVTPTYLLPDPAIQAKFGCAPTEWGRPRYGEIQPDGTVIVVSSNSTTDLRMMILRTTVATFSDPGGFSLVFTSPYAPPPGYDTTTIGFARPTTLPNLGITVSALAEYSADGLASTAFPGDERSLGFASSDSGLTWSRVIDTDDPVLGRQFFSNGKHLHRLQAFEWFDQQNTEWKIGAVGLLGDGAGATGEIFAYSPFPTYPPEGQNALLTQERTKVDTAHMLTDLFPINLSAAPGQPLTFLQGPDGESSGIVKISVDAGVQQDSFVFRPTIPWQFSGQRRIFNRLPYIFEMARLGNGCIAAPTFDTGDKVNPNGIWLSDPSGAHWATVTLMDGDGFKTADPFGQNFLWSQLNVGPRPIQTSNSSLWDLVPPEVRQSLSIGSGARLVQWLGLPVEAQPTVTDVTGSVTLPDEVPDATPVYRIRSETMAKNQGFWSSAASIPDAQAGEWVTLEYWVRCVKLDQGVQFYRQGMSLSLPGGGVQSSWPMWIEPTINDWQRVMLVEQIPAAGVVGVTTSASMVDAASASYPLDYYVTEPQLYVSSQPEVQRVEPGSEGADRLTVALPALSTSWSVMVSGTEARSWVMSLVAQNGDAAVIQPEVHQFPLLDPELNLREGIDVSLTLSTILGGNKLIRGRSSSHDVFFPTQNLVVLTKNAASNRLTMWVSRGLGDLDEIKVLGVALTPSELRFGTPDWSQSFEGLVHTVKVWPDRAITREEIELERYGGRFTGYPPAPVICRADFDGDGATTVFDFGILALHFGEGSGATGGDADGDGDVDIFDFGILASELGCIASE